MRLSWVQNPRRLVQALLWTHDSRIDDGHQDESAAGRLCDHPREGQRDKTCVDVWPVSCTYLESDALDRMLCINPDECIDCAPCEPESVRRCDLSVTEAVPPEWAEYIDLNCLWFEDKHAVRAAYRRPQATGAAGKLDDERGNRIMRVQAGESTLAEEFRTLLPELKERFIDAYNRRDLSAVTNFYVEDAYLLFPNKNIVRGREAIRDYHSRQMGSGQRFVSMTTQALVTEATSAIEITDGIIEVSGEDGQKARHAARVVAIWRRQADGGWKLEADIFA